MDNIEQKKHNYNNCKQVSGMTPSQVKKVYGRPSKSAKEILREVKPEVAMTMSLNDWMVYKQNKDLESLVDIDKHLLKAFEEMTKIGIKVLG